MFRILLTIRDKPVTPLYDALLIDEGQDLPPSFFQLVHKFTSDRKRIVWAYDDLQKLSEAQMPDLGELFGYDQKGKPLVFLENVEGQPHQDIVLQICYRTPPWTLTAAHALGFGLYRAGSKIQHFDDPTYWTDIGYERKSGELQAGKAVRLERKKDSAPAYFWDSLKEEDAVQWKTFQDPLEQASWIAESILKNLEEDELEFDDILIVLPDAQRARGKAATLKEALRRVGLPAHLAGVTSSRDVIFSPDSIAMAQIYRSKGNEAGMVYVVDSQYCLSGPTQITLRNILFTSITRSKAWVRICGWGSGMEELEQELNSLKQNNFLLDFTIPTPEELSQMRRIHRERTAVEQEVLAQRVDALRGLLTALESGDVDFDSLPLDLRGRLGKLLSLRETNDHTGSDAE